MYEILKSLNFYPNTDFMTILGFESESSHNGINMPLNFKREVSNFNYQYTNLYTFHKHLEQFTLVGNSFFLTGRVNNGDLLDFIISKFNFIPANFFLKPYEGSAFFPDKAAQMRLYSDNREVLFEILKKSTILIK